MYNLHHIKKQIERSVYNVSNRYSSPTVKLCQIVIDYFVYFLFKLCTSYF